MLAQSSEFLLHSAQALPGERVVRVFSAPLIYAFGQLARSAAGAQLQMPGNGVFYRLIGEGAHGQRSS
ncbi:hypothetical protein ULF88_22045 [Halopseudomonas pachastrellae]|nr:hypothetical protein [Halopseudomonas pachastrellae]